MAYPAFPYQQPPKSRLPLVLVVIAGAVALLCAAGAATAVWLRGTRPAARQTQDSTISAQPVQAQGLAIATVGKPEAKVTLDLYEDYLCPACALFEEREGERIAKAVEAGQLRVRFHMLNFLNRHSASGDYSSRAAGAALSVFQKAPDKFLVFHAKLLAQDTQPQEGGSSDLSDDQLAKIAEEVGAGAAAADIRSGANVKAAEDAAAASTRQLQSILKRASTPSVLKDDQPVDWQHDAQWLQKLVGAP
ncbi:thioredoxin domain-containing protein [Segniliparus rugosus]|uniref:Thioredoxin-like fold domain-containing protein n=1 Tax=Segniliparus rugosus (strain ATCC BAA-974 / DSM 45345 / CCUG 50838 / CIP 108380 / JCM 13579 / CDC 945) TaxID=679197 RepID=E5XRY6_SEGRC|nr:thioredoxin domain-containing protein [Segniliparus rugosus]EFV12884.1 hypothetical protein HMPREF9336_02258 [Segniliparus rugosus ATCC BAA-974]